MSFSTWTGWTGVPPPNHPDNRPPPAGLDPEESVEETDTDSRLSKKWVNAPKPRRNRSNEYIDRYIIERILADDQGLELKWLEEILGEGVRVLNNTGRYIKSEPFIARIRKQKRAVTH